MTLTKTPVSRNRRFSPRNLFETCMALLVLCNYILVIFDLTYIPLRDFWLQGRLQITLLRFNEPIQLGPIAFQELQIPPDKPLEIPFVKGIANYDVVKGIKPYRSTSEYLETVDKLNQIINQKVFNPEFNLQEYRQEIEKILENLRQKSVNMVDNNPFVSAEKTGTLEKIKNKMRLRVFKTENVSAKAAFQKFWTWDYLSQNWEKELKFFNQEIQPLIETNYFRPLGEDGRPIDNFEAIDFFFGTIFFWEFMLRTWWIARTHKGLRWREAMLWRWYDIFLFVPIWRWLRFIPTVIRLDQVKIINLRLIKEQAVKGLVALISKDITEIIVLRIINKIQEYIRRGQVEKFIDRSLNGGYNNLNDTNEVIEIFRLVVNSTVDKVLPQVKPEAEALIKYNIEKILSQTPAYQSLLRLPGMKGLKTDLSNRLSSQLYQSFVNIADKITQEDEVFERLLQQLVQRFGQSLAGELQSRHSLERIEMLLIIFLEEVKLNYVQEFSDEDLETILEQTRLLHSQSTEINPAETMNSRLLP
ncbi:MULTISPECIES: hypothetical protein [Microcystis]|uniref:hypothetical protein n=1 Tax=Microcystis TaxID=1125 RepID=UPI000CE9F65B|nr:MULTISPECIES: hypothetical protein [Microcystis]MCA2719882.1 hypothetical protein [Microcystis sp. M169S2]WNF16142.1 hypothetical protein RKE53_07080 [Microcystis aeruginosa NRERC-214]